MSWQSDPSVRYAPSHRVVDGLLMADLSSTVPWLPSRRKRGAKGKGQTYEKRVGLELTRRLGPDTRLGQWLCFTDRGGSGFAQPDAYFVGPRAVLVFEAKLTQTNAGVLQIKELYAPLLRAIYRRPVVGVMVCRNLVREPGDTLITGPEAVLNETQERVWTWHWLGVRNG